uniref:Uncharacterized protein n=1 Tax=viral metagenome TaxID=1070528 RepID=A0A6C0FHU5_9ZZZZ|tara:strand:- start:8595 stop:8984 length:390 start_codon:yes stop_codon:yes gene_type:complete
MSLVNNITKITKNTTKFISKNYLYIVLLIFATFVIWTFTTDYIEISPPQSSPPAQSSPTQQSEDFELYQKKKSNLKPASVDETPQSQITSAFSQDLPMPVNTYGTLVDEKSDPAYCEGNLGRLRCMAHG